MQWISSLCFVLFILRNAVCGDKLVKLVDPDNPTSGSAITCRPQDGCAITKKHDGDHIFKLKETAVGENDVYPILRDNAISFESVKFPGYYMVERIKNGKKLIMLDTINSNSKADRKSATFIQHFKVSTHSYVFQVAGRYYNFICNIAISKGGQLYTGIDDDSKYFADRCSYDMIDIKDDEVKGQPQTGAGDKANAGGGGAGGLPGSGGKGDGGKGNFVKLFIPGPPGIRPTLGLKADLFQKVRVGMPPDQFIIKSPGLNGVEGTYSFESAKYPMFYLQRIGRDIYLEALKRNQDFYASATFKATPYINKKNRYFVSPYSQPEWFLGHLHVPPFYVRAMYNNNTAEFDLDVSWIFKYQKQKELFGLGTHHDLFRALIKLLSLVHGPLTASQESAIFQALHGNTDLTELGNSTAIMQLLQSQHNSLLLSQLATINGLQGVKPVIPPAADASALSDATTAAGSVAGATAGSAAGTNTGGAGGTSGGTSVGTSGGTSGGSVTDKVKTDNKPETEVVVEKYEPWSDWSSCSAQCGAGHQIRVRPCKVNAQTCTPLQQSQSCVAAAPCQPAGTVQASPQVVQTVPQVAQAVPPVVQAAPVAQATGGCPMTCGYDCNPTSCPLSCCSSSLVKKHHIAKVKHFKRKFERAIKHRGHHKQ
ncbi:uncharacterized protein LOC135683065 isoform X1 [Rhopilema esculentum]|uniref:uncharacterized protein LOC135683065 isoform X1 n=1 Tax=Rhopilema esculentum TaxID=499914 RepID=UPI0031D021E9